MSAAPRKSTRPAQGRSRRARSSSKTTLSKSKPAAEARPAKRRTTRRKTGTRGPVRIALFGDIHGNFEALEAVLADIKSQGITRLVCLGDIVGYGAEPARCLERVNALNCPVVQGNHDRESTSNSDLADYRHLARVAMEFTRGQLSPDHKRRLSELPMVLAGKGYTVVHSSLVAPEAFFYVDSVREAAFHFFEQETDVCFVGHTHVPGVFAQTGNGRVIEDWGCPEKLVMDKGNRYLINVGSVGQPRDRDWRACYVVYTPSRRELEWRRIEYDVESARAKINAAGLPSALGERILVGV